MKQLLILVLLRNHRNKGHSTSSIKVENQGFSKVIHLVSDLMKIIDSKGIIAAKYRELNVQLYLKIYFHSSAPQWSPLLQVRLHIAPIRFDILHVYLYEEIETSISWTAH